MMFSKTLAAFLVLAAPASAFVSQQPSAAKASTTALDMNLGKSMQTAAASVVAAAFIMANTIDVAPAAAMDDFFGSSQIVSARSGGRAGGRASSVSSRPSAPRSSSSSSSTTNTRVIERTTYIAPQPTYMASPVIMAPSYNPMPGLGLSLGLNAVSQIGNDMRDARQENEIRSTQSELREAQRREAAMSARLNQLEANQQVQTMSQQQQLALQQAQMNANQAALLAK